MVEPFSCDLTHVERAGLCLLERGAMTPSEFFPAVALATEAGKAFRDGGPADTVAVAREARDALTSLARKGLATLAGSRWQVTPNGRELALRLQAVQGVRP
jgi:hypothetical protein